MTHVLGDMRYFGNIDYYPRTNNTGSRIPSQEFQQCSLTLHSFPQCTKMMLRIQRGAHRTAQSRPYPTMRRYGSKSIESDTDHLEGA